MEGKTGAAEAILSAANRLVTIWLPETNFGVSREANGVAAGEKHAIALVRRGEGQSDAAEAPVSMATESNENSPRESTIGGENVMVGDAVGDLVVAGKKHRDALGSGGEGKTGPGEALHSTPKRTDKRPLF